MAKLKPKDRLVSQTLRTCPHCRNDLLVNEAEDGSIPSSGWTCRPMGIRHPDMKNPAVMMNGGASFKDDVTMKTTQPPEDESGSQPKL